MDDSKCRHILIAIPNFDRGGIARALKNLLDLLDDCKDLSIDVYCGYPKGIFEGELRNCHELPSMYLHRILATDLRFATKWEKVQALFFKSLRHLMLKLTGWDLLRYAGKRIASYLSKRKYDCAIAFCETYPSWWVEDMEAKRKLVWIHNDYSFIRGDMICHPDFTKYDGIICVSKAARIEFLKFYPELSDKIKVIYNVTSVDDVRTKAGLDSELDASFLFDGFKIVSIGRIAYEKGFVRIPAIARALLDKERLPDFRWYIIGNGSEIETRQLLDEIRDKGVDTHVILLGEKSNPYPYLKRADLFALTSVYESYGIVVDEAKILGIPIVSTEYSAVHEVLPEKFGKILPIEEFPQFIAQCMENRDMLDYYRTNLKSYLPSNDIILSDFIDIVSLPIK